jgi:hypothetical protein
VVHSNKINATGIATLLSPFVSTFFASFLMAFHGRVGSERIGLPDIEWFLM